MRLFHAAVLIVMASLAIPCDLKAAVNPSPQGHAHNDYEHKRPLFDALDNGFRSVEADIYLVDGRLLVGHTRRALRPDRTLQSLYLDPLREQVRKHGGNVDGVRAPFLLFIDIKTAGQKTYAILRKVLDRYADILVNPSSAEPKHGAIEVVVSGDRPIEHIAADNDRKVGIDGRLSDLDSDRPANLMPIISDNWRLHFTWRGKGPMPPEEQVKLREIVHKAHAHGRRLRFWATPESPALWQVLYENKVDLINTDDLRGLSQFLQKARESH